MRSRSFIIAVLFLLVTCFLLTSTSSGHVRYPETRVWARDLELALNVKSRPAINPDHIRFEPLFSTKSSSSALVIAKETDLATGQTYFGARYYDQNTGRFTSTDPFKGYYSDPRSLHRYNYAFNNPLVYVDPYGFVTYTEHGGVNYYENITEGKNYYLDWAGYFVSDFMSLNPLAENIAKAQSPDVSIGQRVWSGTKAGAQVGMEFIGGKVIGGGVKLSQKGIKAAYKKAVTNKYLANISKKVGDVATETAKAIGNKLNELRLDEVGQIDVLEPIRRLTGRSSKSVVKETKEIAEITSERVTRPSIKKGLSKAEKGRLGEVTAEKTIKRAGYQQLPSKMPGNRGIDGVFVKIAPDGSIQDIIITESKYSSTGRASLAVTSTKGKQLSQQWIDATINEMLRCSDVSVQQTGRLLNNNRSLIRLKANVLDPLGINSWSKIHIPEN